MYKIENVVGSCNVYANKLSHTRGIERYMKIYKSGMTLSVFWLWIKQNAWFRKLYDLQSSGNIEKLYLYTYKPRLKS